VKSACREAPSIGRASSVLLEKNAEHLDGTNFSSSSQNAFVDCILLGKEEEKYLRQVL